MQVTDLFKHKHSGNIVQLTAANGGWVEFLSNGSLFWLEEPVFVHAYQYYRDGDPINADLAALRAMAREANILIPKELA